MSDYFNRIAKLVGQDMVKVAEDGSIADNEDYIDTGCYVLNIVLSGSLRKGCPMNKVAGFAALEAVGKSFIVIQILKNFLDTTPNGLVLYNDTEGRIDKEMLSKRGVDLSRVMFLYPEYIEEFKNMNYQIVRDYLDGDKKKADSPVTEATPDSVKKDKKKKEAPAVKPKLLLVVDSLTQLPSYKQITDAGKDSDAGDMGSRAKVWRSAWQTLRQILSKAKIPTLCTNHTYQTTGMFPTTELAGGGGFKYAADIIAMMGKQKDAVEVKDAAGKIKKVVNGTVIHFKIAKGWNIKQHSEFRTYLSYSKGLDKYFGLQDLALEAGLFKKIDGGYLLSGDRKVKERELLLNPTAYYTEELLDQIEAFVKERYCFSDKPPEETISELIGDEE